VHGPYEKRQQPTAHVRTSTGSFCALLSRGGVGTDTILCPPGERSSGVECIARNAFASIGGAPAVEAKAGVSVGSDVALPADDEKGRTSSINRSSSASTKSRNDAPRPRPCVAPAEESEDEEEACAKIDLASKSERSSVARENVRDTPCFEA
jgi:hypothetical protein